jgi:hypothetical protein
LRDIEAAIAGVPDDASLTSTKPARLVPDEQPARRCVHCGKDLLEALVCSRCGAFYCSPECQKAHWPEHKAACTARRGC